MLSDDAVLMLSDDAVASAHRRRHILTTQSVADAIAPVYAARDRLIQCASQTP